MVDLNFNIVKSNRNEGIKDSILYIDKTTSFTLNKMGYYHDASIISDNYKCFIRFRSISITKEILNE